MPRIGPSAGPISSPIISACVRLAGRRDGIEGALILRERLGLPVVFVTNQIDAQATARATEVEPVAYLTKPVGSRDLIEAVEKAMASR